MLRRVLAWPFAPQRRTLTVLLAILVAAVFIATGTGFWLLYRIAYIVAMGIPVALCSSAWLNTRALDVPWTGARCGGRWGRRRRS